MSETSREMPRLSRLGERDRTPVAFEIDGTACQALAGDTVLVAILANRRHLRESEFGDGRRAGFCLMGACQDCWVWTAEGQRIRACSTPLAEGMRLLSSDPWPNAPAT